MLASKLFYKGRQIRINILSHLVFSSRYVFILAPIIVFPGLNPMSMYLPNLELLSFRVVLALPIAYLENKINVYKKNITHELTFADCRSF